jgi:hypothetical protein
MNAIPRMTSVLALGLPIALVSAAALGGLSSGPKKGAAVTAFEPYHVTGADAGTYTCPVCKYGLLPNVQVWVNRESDAKVEAIAKQLEKAMDSHADQKLKAFVIFLKPAGTSDAAEKTHLATLAKAAGVKKVAFMFANPNDEFVKPYKINPDTSVHTTLLVTKHRVVIENLVNASAGDSRIESAIQNATS